MSCLSVDIGIKNLAFCICDSGHKIVDWKVVEIQNTNVRVMIESIHQLFEQYDFQCIILEKQPSRNIKMRMVENTLAVYFIMSGVSKVIQYSPKHKLGDIGKTTRGRANYTLRKKMGISMCGKYIEEHETEWIEYFNKHKKKDDLADCLLQYIAYHQIVNLNDLTSGIVKIN